MVGNGISNWDIDVSPSYPQTVFNFNLIPRSMLNKFEDNGCKYYFNDAKPSNNSKLCN
jgi:hypothetical protein